jgi:hypothetical protein
VKKKLGMEGESQNYKCEEEDAVEKIFKYLDIKGDRNMT